MRGGSSSKQEAKEAMEELDKLNNKLKPAEPPLSGAYIRSLVKQLTVASKTEHPMALNPKHQGCAVVDGNGSRNFTKHGKFLDATARQQQRHKKQVRKRLHTSRPYQERPLNMAEARKEIATALKFHRAAMKQTIEQKQQQAQEQQQHASVTLQPSQHPSFELDGRFKSKRNPRIYPSCSITNFSNFMDDFSFSYSPSVPNTYSVSSPIAPPPFIAENPNLILPNQTLGLNLNFHDFNNVDDTLYLGNNNNNPSLGSPYSSPTSSSPPLSQEAPSIGISEKKGVSPSTIESGATTQVNGGLHRAMDDEGIAEIRSLGEQYQMEWNDTMNLVTSAWWFNIFNNMEHGAPEVKTEGDDDATHNFDELIEFPAWLNANESCLEQCSEDYFRDPTLPW